jgi:DNA-directed RNA polymerase specialized sigma24 family protein
VHGSVASISHTALNKSEFETLLAWLAPARDQAGERYESTRRMLTRYFECRRCVPADEYVDETIDRVARRLAAGEQIQCADPNAYFRGVARNLCLECQKQRSRQAKVAQLSLPVQSDWSPLPACLAHCLHRLSRDRRQLLEAYYLNQREELPARLGITPNAVRLRVFKEKRRLRDCMVRCAKLAAYSFMATAENAVPAPMLSFERRSHRK